LIAFRHSLALLKSTLTMNVRYTAAALLLVLICGTGCMRSYQIKLSNGNTLVTSSKPQLKDGSYQFKDASGQLQVIPKSRVREIAPASHKSEASSPFIGTPATGR
jgi:hypothetical protein